MQSRAQLHRGRERFTFVRCDRCGLVYLNPRVPESALGDYYDASYLPHRGARAWGRFARWAEEGERRTDARRVRLARRTVSLGAGSTVLDVGCGRPTFLEALARATGARGTGTDPSATGWADEPARWAATGLTLLAGPVPDAPPGAPFDLITLWHALEHDYRPRRTLERLRTLVRPAGALIVEVPNYDSLTRRLHGAAWAGFHTPRHTAVYTPATLRAMLERTGWRVEQQMTYGTLDPYVLYWLGRQERAERTLDGDLARAFPGFMAGKVVTLPFVLAQRRVSLGVQTAVARPAPA